MDSPAPPSDQVRHTQVGGGEIPVLQHLEHPEQSPYKGVTTRPSKGMKNTDKNVSLRKRTHRAESRRKISGKQTLVTRGGLAAGMTEVAVGQMSEPLRRPLATVLTKCLTTPSQI